MNWISKKFLFWTETIFWILLGTALAYLLVHIALWILREPVENLSPVPLPSACELCRRA